MQTSGSKHATNEYKRGRTRVSYSAHAMVKSGKIGAIKGMVRDIAIDALYLHIKPIFEIDDHVKVEIILLGAGSQLIINVPAVVTRQDRKGVAMRFVSPLEWWPVFTFFPLHNLDGETAQKEKYSLNN